MVKIKKLETLYRFHGHRCPMSTLGFRAGSLAKKLLKLKRSDCHIAEAIISFKSCAIDGVQIAFPATFGNSNVKLFSEKEMFFVFINRKKKEQIEISFTDSLKKIMETFLDSRKRMEVNKNKKSISDVKKAFENFLNFTQNAGYYELFSVKKSDL